MASKYCTSCGTQLDSSARYCSACGVKQAGKLPIIPPSAFTGTSPKSAVIAFFLCLFFGNLGVHRFYVGKIGTGLLMLFTAGGFGLWYLYDLISIACNHFYDDQGAVLLMSQNPTAARKVVIILASLLAGFLILMGGLALLVWIFFSSLSSLGHQELSALRSNHLDKAYSYTSQEFKKAVPMINFKKFLNHYPELQTNVSASFFEREINDDRGVVRGSLMLMDGRQVPIEIRFVKEHYQWKIDGMGLGTGKK